ncbi:MAG: hypothetical protein K0R28_5250, partial [Paenibacillus sp.]|nr:hypothetical protein [Paenibacillus sp.]
LEKTELKLPAFIERCFKYRVEKMCELLNVARSGIYGREAALLHYLHRLSRPCPFHIRYPS